MTTPPTQFSVTLLLVLFSAACQASGPTATPTPRLSQLEAIGIVQESLASRFDESFGDCLGLHLGTETATFEATYEPVEDTGVGPVWLVTHETSFGAYGWLVFDSTGIIFRARPAFHRCA